MATVRDICTRALRRAHIVASGEPVAAEQLSDALQSFIDLAEEWRDAGLDLGIRDGAGIDDTLTVDRGAISALVWNLAVEVAEEQGAAIRPLMVQRAERTRAALQNRQLGSSPLTFDRAITRSSVYDINLE